MKIPVLLPKLQSSETEFMEHTSESLDKEISKSHCTPMYSTYSVLCYFVHFQYGLHLVPTSFYTHIHIDTNIHILTIV